MSYSEFVDYDEGMAKFCETLTRNVEAQLAFNRVVAKRLNLKPLENVSSKPKEGDVAFG